MKHKNAFKQSLISILVSLLIGCVGPVSPFGGIEIWSADGHQFEPQNINSANQDITVSPRRQVLHKPSDFKIEFNLDEKPQLKVTYNKKDVTNTFLKSATLKEDTDKQIQVLFNELNLKPDRRHKIDIYWLVHKFSSYFHLAYLPPYCLINEARSIASTAPFNPKSEYINTIYTTAYSQKLNPAMLAGLIAQESGFDPNQVSSAKAVGLTQVTPIADAEIQKMKPDWKRDKRILKLNATELKYKIQTREISHLQDWRLNPNQSIEGGAIYINYLINYWSLKENKDLLTRFPEIDFSEVVLSSYNSGAARVKSKIRSAGSDWLDDEELKEAFKYVNSVISYCYHFSEE